MKWSTRIWILTAILGIIVLAIAIIANMNRWVTTIFAFVSTIGNVILSVNGIINDIYVDNDIRRLKYRVEQLENNIK